MSRAAPNPFHVQASFCSSPRSAPAAAQSSFAHLATPSSLTSRRRSRCVVTCCRPPTTPCQPTLPARPHTDISPPTAARRSGATGDGDVHRHRRPSHGDDHGARGRVRQAVFGLLCDFPLVQGTALSRTPPRRTAPSRRLSVPRLVQGWPPIHPWSTSSPPAAPRRMGCISTRAWSRANRDKSRRPTQSASGLLSRRDPPQAVPSL